jgi:hypothetical protein
VGVLEPLPLRGIAQILHGRGIMVAARPP